MGYEQEARSQKFFDRNRDRIIDRPLESGKDSLENMLIRIAWTDQKTEEFVGRLLRFGVTTAATIVLAGGAIYLVRHGLAPANYRVFAGEPSDLREWRGIVHEALHGRGRGIIQLGLLVLLLTPVARVIFAAFAFAMERDWFYVAVSAFVFLVLLYSMAGSGI